MLNTNFLISTTAPNLNSTKFLLVATCYVPVCTKNLQILTVICCIHHIHHMSRTPFLILNFLDFDVYVVMTPIFPANQRSCASSSKNVAILSLWSKRAIIAPNNLIQYNTIQHSLFNEGNVINPMSYLTYGLHNGTKYTYKTMPNQQYTTYYNRN